MALSGASRRKQIPSSQPETSGIGGDVSVGFVYWTSHRFAQQVSYAGIAYSSVSFDNFKNQASEKLPNW
jgi:hypothetical protein